jgi:hypothetical protein
MTLTTRRDEPMTITPADSTLVLAAAIDRLAQSLEQLVLTRLDGKPAAAPPPASDDFVEIGDADLPVRQAPVPTSYGQCPVHKVDWKFVPAGVSKRTGAKYDSFYACPTMGCTQRPPA